MENKSKKTVARTAYGKTIAPLTYEFKWTAYTTNDELVAAKDEMTLDEQRKSRNKDAQTKARGAALTLALEAAGIVKPTAENDEQVRLKDAFRTIMTAKLPDGSPKYTEQQAREVAATVTGVDWPDEDED